MQYTVDLNNCRGGSALKVGLNGLVGAVYGSAVGAKTAYIKPGSPWENWPRFGGVSF